LVVSSHRGTKDTENTEGEVGYGFSVDFYWGVGHWEEALDNL